MKQKKYSSYSAVIISVLFLAAILTLTVYGAQTYQRCTASREDNNQKRSLSSYLVTCARANDTSESMSVIEGEYGTVLVIPDGDSGYAFRIYLLSGQLLEDYNTYDAALNPADAQTIGETDIFEAEFISAGTISVSTDFGTVLLHNRSVQEGRA